MRTTNDVTVLGCGLMGSALAQAFAKSGYSVAVWNCTPERAEALAGESIRPVRSIEDAVGSSRLVVACMSTYDTTLSALDPVAAWQGTTLVNLASGAPQEAETMESWAAERGVEYLDGSIVCYPKDIGTPEATILYSGSIGGWTEHSQTLMSLAGASAYVSEKVMDASLLNVGIVGAFFVSALSAYVEAATYVLSQGVAVELVHAVTQVAIEGLQKATGEAAVAIVSDDHTTDQATIETYAEAADAALTVMQESGQWARLLEAATENLTAAALVGLGSQGFYALSKVARVDPVPMT